MNPRNRVALVLLVFAWTTSSCVLVNQVENSSGQDNWQTYTSDEGGFVILFPTNPTVESMMSDSLEVQTASAVKDNIYYRASFGNLPAYSTQDYSPEAILDATVDKTANDTGGGKLIYKKEISLQNNPGVEFKIEWSSNNLVLIGRVYLVDKTHMYTQNAGTTIDNVSNSNIKKFLDSFALIK